MIVVDTQNRFFSSTNVTIPAVPTSPQSYVFGIKSQIALSINPCVSTHDRHSVSLWVTVTISLIRLRVFLLVYISHYGCVNEEDEAVQTHVFQKVP